LISVAEKKTALDSLAVELNRVVVQPIDIPTLEVAKSMVDRHYLRTLDAVQLGSAVMARHFLKNSDIRFVTSDQALLQAARAERFEIWDPEV
jgi:hypothetical protein